MFAQLDCLKKMSFALLALCALLCLAAPSARAQSDGCTVEANNPHSTIQQAVDNGCSQIRVTPGTYYENVVIPAGQTVSITSVEGAAKTLVDGGGAGSVFTINSGANVTLTGLTVQNGSTGFGGGIYNAGAVTLNNSPVTHNIASYYGGGIENHFGTVTLNSSPVTNNSVPYFGGGIHSFLGTVTLNNSAVTDNTALYGGGILNSYGTLTLNSSNVTSNSAYQGGGIYNNAGKLTLNSSPVTNNSASSVGGGIYNYLGMLTFNSSNVTGNTPDGIYNF